MREKIYAGLDLGSSEIILLIGLKNKRGVLRIIGKGTVVTQGIRKAQVNNFELLAKEVQQVIEQAENEADVTLNSLYLAQSGEMLKGMVNEGTVRIRGAQNVVMQRDVEHAKEEAQAKELPAHALYIQNFFNEYLLDGISVENPLNMTGHFLKARYWSIYSKADKIRQELRLLNGFGLKVEQLLAAGIASALSVTRESDRQRGVLVVDIGHGVSDYVLYKNEQVLTSGVIPVGGYHLSNDLSLGLKIPYAEAEDLKRRLMINPKGISLKEGVILFNQQERQLEVVEIIIRARLEELFQLILQRLTQFDLGNLLNIEVILTGGSSALLGIEYLASKVLKTQVTIGTNLCIEENSVQEARYSTVLGLLLQADKASAEVGRQKWFFF